MAVDIVRANRELTGLNGINVDPAVSTAQTKTLQDPDGIHRDATRLAELDASLLKRTYVTEKKPVPEHNSQEAWAKKTCSDHMVTAAWTNTTGWSPSHLHPYQPLTLAPTASVLHYATTCFEGLKLYRGHDNRLRLFRPSLNALRMRRSAVRIGLPAFSPPELLKLITTLCAIDAPRWLPRDAAKGRFIYVRPTMVATDASLGVEKPKEALLYVMLVCMPDMDAEPKGMTLLASEEDVVRAWPGGFGHAKVGANYGPTLAAQGEARRKGFTAVLWLLAREGRVEVTEVGASNFFVVWRTREGELEMVTPALEGKLILDGITRRSLVELGKERLRREMSVVERFLEMREVVEAVEDGRMVEAFAAGTAVFVSPISMIGYQGRELKIPRAEGYAGKYAKMLRGWMMDIKYGREEHEWGYVVEDEDKMA